MTNIFASPEAKEGLMVLLVITGVGIIEPRVAFGFIFVIALLEALAK